ncbi:LOW QUALITY PROTEIN: ankyrin and armadillo repeat-containing protein [Cariama cristata]
MEEKLDACSPVFLELADKATCLSDSVAQKNAGAVFVKSDKSLIDTSTKHDFGTYDENMNEDPTYNPNSTRGEKKVFMQYADNMLFKLILGTTELSYMKMYLGLMCKKTERELPLFGVFGPNLKCFQHFQYAQNEYFYVHGGTEFDVGTPSVKDILLEIMILVCCLSSTLVATCRASGYKAQLFDMDMPGREHYPIPGMEFDGKSITPEGFCAVRIQLSGPNDSSFGRLTGTMPPPLHKAASMMGNLYWILSAFIVSQNTTI